MSQLPDAFKGHDLTGWSVLLPNVVQRQTGLGTRIRITVSVGKATVTVGRSSEDFKNVRGALAVANAAAEGGGGWAPAPIGCSADPGWQPIETAPKNGETIIIADITTDGVVMEHYAAIYHPDYKGDDYCWKSLDYTLDPPIQGWLCVCPTHWRPLLGTSEVKP